MTDGDVSRVPVWQIPRLDPAYIYVIQADGRLKIGKSKSPSEKFGFMTRHLRQAA